MSTFMVVRNIVIVIFIMVLFVMLFGSIAIAQDIEHKFHGRIGFNLSKPSSPDDFLNYWSMGSGGEACFSYTPSRSVEFGLTVGYRVFPLKLDKILEVTGAADRSELYGANDVKLKSFDLSFRYYLDDYYINYRFYLMLKLGGTWSNTGAAYNINDDSTNVYILPIEKQKLDNYHLGAGADILINKNIWGFVEVAHCTVLKKSSPNTGYFTLMAGLKIPIWLGF